MIAQERSAAPVMVMTALTVLSFAVLASVMIFQSPPEIMGLVFWVWHSAVCAGIMLTLFLVKPEIHVSGRWIAGGGLLAYAGVVATGLAFFYSHEAWFDFKHSAEFQRVHVLPPVLAAGAVASILGARMALRGMGLRIENSDRVLCWIILAAGLVSLPIQAYAATPAYALPPEIFYSTAHAVKRWLLLLPTIAIVIAAARRLAQTSPQHGLAFAALWWTGAYFSLGVAALTVAEYVRASLFTLEGPLQAIVLSPLLLLAAGLVYAAWRCFKRAG